MSEAFRLSDYQIRIGNEDIVERHLHGILSSDPENVDNQEKARKALDELLREMRVRFGTIIKTDNVSFLIGAGASLAAGGVSLACIPKPLEKALIDKAAGENKGKWGTLPTNFTSSLYPRLTIRATPDVVIPLASAYFSAKPKLQKRCYPNNHP